MIVNELDFSALSNVSGHGFASASDINAFESGLAGSYYATSPSIINSGQLVNATSERNLRNAMRNHQESGDTALDIMARYVAENKNKAILEARASSFKKASELAKEISF